VQSAPGVFIQMIMVMVDWRLPVRGNRSMLMLYLCL